MVNVMKAAYVVESRVHLCCVPSTLCFASLEDAQDFVLGFGGMVMDFEQATAYLTDQHHHAKMR
jgi:nitrous oxide reductase accessory protein NosL